MKIKIFNYIIQIKTYLIYDTPEYLSMFFQDSSTQNIGILLPLIFVVAVVGSILL